VYLSLGSNLGDRLRYLKSARELLGSHPNIKIIASSGIYESEPWGMEDLAGDTQWFLNQCLEIETCLLPLDLLVSLQKIETELGRKRSRIRYSPRTIDIDILLYGGKTIKLPNLIIPHPRIDLRKFVLLPLLEIAPDLKDPVSGVSFQIILQSTRDKDYNQVKIYHEHKKS